MRIARHASRLFKDQSVRDVETAGGLAADVLAASILPQATAELDRHRSEGTVLLLATTAPHELATAFASIAGFDEVLCTRYRSIDGVYDGTNHGGYIWGEEKAAAVAEWAGRHAVDLTESYAYSDSWYDVPLLELVGTPAAVNADVRLNLYARTKGWTRHTWAEDGAGS